MSFAILALGTAVPPTTLTQAEAVNLARILCARTPEQASWLPDLYNGSGVFRRHIAFAPAVIRDILEGTRTSRSIFLPSGQSTDRGPTSGDRMRHYAEQAPTLALRAAHQALGRSGITASDVTHLVTVSCTGFRAPGVDIALIRGLHLSPEVGRTHLGFMGCHGAVNALRVAGAFTGSDPMACVLVCAVELCALHYHYGWDPQKMVANALFADGAAAVVGVSEVKAGRADWRMSATGSCLFPESGDAMTWAIGDHEFEMTLSKLVPGLILANLQPWLLRWLGNHGLGLRDIGSWAVHPGGPRILDAVRDSLGLAEGDLTPSREVLACCGNMSSPTLLFILDRLLERGAARPCVALAFGPGLVVEAVLFR
jgi:predicted naringenin-chalcone synthase